MRRTGLVYCSVAWVLGVWAAAVARATDDVNNCIWDGRPTMDDCWGCFNQLLGDCDANYEPGTPTHQACLSAANFFFSWCAMRIPVDGDGSGAIRAPAIGGDVRRIRFMVDGEADLREGVEFTIGGPYALNQAGVRMWRHAVSAEGEVVLLELPVVMDRTEPELGGRGVYWADTSVAGLVDPGSHTLVVAIVDKHGDVLHAEAHALSFTDSFDLNRDGVFDAADRAEAIRLFRSGEMDESQAMEIIAAP